MTSYQKLGVFKSRVFSKKGVLVNKFLGAYVTQRAVWSEAVTFFFPV